MTTLMRSAFEMIQGTGSGGTQGAASTKAPPATNRDQELRDAAEQLKAAIQKNVSQELIQARAQAAAERAAAVAQRVQGTPPTPTAPVGPFGPGRFTITSQDGQTVIGVPPRGEGGIPREAVTISVAFFLTIAAIIIFLPVARAFARAMDRRSAPGQVPAEVSSQLEHLNQAVDAIALEVERISEGQRFTTRLLTEQRETTASLPTGANR